MSPVTRGLLLGLVLLAALAAGFYFGGDTDQKVSWFGIAALALCVLLADLCGSPKSARSRLLSAAAAAAIFALGWFAAVREVESAFDDCVERGGEVRRALGRHRERFGAYPAKLDELRGIELPGDRFLRPTLLRYFVTEDGYILEISDGWVRATANPETGFFGTH